jgi:hypothetical protein
MVVMHIFMRSEDWRWTFNDNDLQKEIYLFFGKQMNTWSMRAFPMFDSLFYSCFVHKMRKCYQYILIFIFFHMRKKNFVKKFDVYFWSYLSKLKSASQNISFVFAF